MSALWVLIAVVYGSCWGVAGGKKMAQKSRVQVMLYDNADMRIEGKLIGFDEYMNVVLDDADELSIKRKTRKALGMHLSRCL